MEDFITWIVDNKEWLFSGVGLIIVGWVGRLFFKKTYSSSTQTIRSGDSSTSVQAGRDVNIGMKDKSSDVEKE